MSTHSGPSPTAPTSAVWNTVGREKEISQENPYRPASDAALREYCDKHYNQLLPILAEKMHQEKVQQKRLKAVKARLNFEEARSLQITKEERSGKKDSVQEDGESSRRDTESCYQSSRSRGAKIAPKRNDSKRGSSRRTEALFEEEDSVGGHWKTKSKRQKSSI
ncbi:hypothetical protein Tco_0123045 [Tanacetum coccineum]